MLSLSLYFPPRYSSNPLHARSLNRHCVAASQVTCTDVFAMPQHGTGVSVEAVDPVFQTKMLDMLKQTGRPEMVVGWYHSHRESHWIFFLKRA